MALQMDDEQRAVFERTLAVMSEFKRVFGKSPSPDLLAEVYTCLHLNLNRNEGANQRGYDAVSADGICYQIKYRASATPIVDINNFDFDYLVLVNLDDDFRLLGLWRISVEQAKKISIYRSHFRKYQTSQSRVKEIAERIV